jgi:hypothetical protein
MSDLLIAKIPLMKLTQLFGRKQQEAIANPRVLVCSLDSAFKESLEADSNIYARHYRRVDSVCFSSIRDLLKAIESDYDIIHLFSSMHPGGLIFDDSGTTLLGTKLIAMLMPSFSGLRMKIAGIIT